MSMMDPRPQPNDRPPTPQEEDEKIEWNTCCSRSSKSFIKYAMTCTVSLIVLSFSMSMIVANSDSDNSIYFSLISSIVALYIPSPHLENEQNH